MPELKTVLEAAYNMPDSLRSCSNFVWHVIQAYVPDQPYMVANDLVKFLARSADWEELDANDSRTMADLAKAGAVVVGGSEDHPNGHVLVVYPGDVKESGGYAYSSNGKTLIMRSHGLYARSMSRALGSWPGAKSDGDKTVWDAWAGPKFSKVRFWVLKSTKPPK
ncbi:hypothetical protein [Dyella acidisoli]|uniref:CHAP domain-containing protein n=1 Tax=Dyella acidisoli TaxID=1867834 RepID=A0ABQ5XTY6_9GAMM|nr:hypothetical protein [Dyella acidisoli]GLQ93784.1 hypothetical protein GCM10007901_27350 [Dyella acidisoli]